MGRHFPNIETALNKPKTLYNENYSLKARRKFLGGDIKIGSITRQNVLAFRVQLIKHKYSTSTMTREL